MPLDWGMNSPEYSDRMELLRELARRDEPPWEPARKSDHPRRLSAKCRSCSSECTREIVLNVASATVRIAGRHGKGYGTGATGLKVPRIMSALDFLYRSGCAKRKTKAVMANLERLLPEGTPLPEFEQVEEWRHEKIGAPAEPRLSGLEENAMLQEYLLRAPRTPDSRVSHREDPFVVGEMRTSDGYVCIAWSCYKWIIDSKEAIEHTGTMTDPFFSSDGTYGPIEGLCVFMLLTVTLTKYKQKLRSSLSPLLLCVIPEEDLPSEHWVAEMLVKTWTEFLEFQQFERGVSGHDECGAAGPAFGGISLTDVADAFHIIKAVKSTASKKVHDPQWAQRVLWWIRYSRHFVTRLLFWRFWNAKLQILLDHDEVCWHSFGKTKLLKHNEAITKGDQREFLNQNLRRGLWIQTGDL